MKRLAFVAILAGAMAETAWATTPGEDPRGGLMSLFVNLLPWALVFLLIWLGILRPMRGKVVVDAAKIEENLARSMVHMDRIEQQNQRIIELLEQIANKP